MRPPTPLRAGDILATVLLRSDRKRLCRETDRKRGGGAGRGFVAVCACSKRDLPCLDSTKHQHTPAHSWQRATNDARRQTQPTCTYAPLFSLMDPGLGGIYPQATIKVSSSMNFSVKHWNSYTRLHRGRFKHLATRTSCYPCFNNHV